MYNIYVQETQPYEKTIFFKIFIIKLWDKKFVMQMIIRLSTCKLLKSENSIPSDYQLIG
jgi:hypothetical protein